MDGFFSFFEGKKFSFYENNEDVVTSASDPLLVSFNCEGVSMIYLKIGEKMIISQR